MQISIKHARSVWIAWVCCALTLTATNKALGQCCSTGASGSQGASCSKISAANISPDMKKYATEEVEITALENDIKGIKTFFNQHQDKKRFIAFLSPVCPYCVDGAKAIRQSILDAYPDKDLRLAIVWIGMFPGDGFQAATETAKILNDPRVVHFYDTEKVAGKAFARQFAKFNHSESQEPAWDIYMFYPEGVVWSNSAPIPKDYVHQLNRNQDHWADQGRYFCQADLYAEIKTLAKKY